MPVRASQGLGPAIPRRRLGQVLRTLRDEQGKTLAQVAGDLLFSTSKLSRLEKGQGPAGERDLRDLLRYYGQVDTDLGDRMRRWAVEGREVAWWQQEAVSPAIDQYIQYETAAAQISGYVINFVPSLLQTPDYARAMYTAMGADGPRDVDHLVALTRRRQEVMTRAAYPASLDVVVDESVLHRMVGGHGVMRVQLAALVEAAAMPNVVIRVYPFAAGPHPALAEGVFTLFHFRRSIDRDVVALERRLVDAYVDDPDDVDNYRELLERLRGSALAPPASAEFLRRMAQAY